MLHCFTIAVSLFLTFRMLGLCLGWTLACSGPPQTPT